MPLNSYGLHTNATNAYPTPGLASLSNSDPYRTTNMLGGYRPYFSMPYTQDFQDDTVDYSLQNSYPLMSQDQAGIPGPSNYNSAGTPRAWNGSQTAHRNSNSQLYLDPDYSNSYGQSGMGHQNLSLRPAVNSAECSNFSLSQMASSLPTPSPMNGNGSANGDRLLPIPSTARHSPTYTRTGDVLQSYNTGTASSSKSSIPSTQQHYIPLSSSPDSLNSYNTTSTQAAHSASTTPTASSHSQSDSSTAQDGLPVYNTTGGTSGTDLCPTTSTSPSSHTTYQPHTSHVQHPHSQNTHGSSSSAHNHLSSTGLSGTTTHHPLRSSDSSADLAYYGPSSQSSTSSLNSHATNSISSQGGSGSGNHGLVGGRRQSHQAGTLSSGQVYVPHTSEAQPVFMGRHMAGSLAGLGMAGHGHGSEVGGVHGHGHQMGGKRQGVA